MVERDRHFLEYLAGFKTGRVWALPEDKPSYRRLEKAGLVKVEVIEPNPGRWPGRFRVAVTITEAGRQAVAAK